MKIKVETLKEKISELRETIVDSSISGIKSDVFGDKKEESLAKELFQYISETSELETYIWETVDNFCSEHISVEDIFNSRNNESISYEISEVIREMDNVLESASVSSIDKLLNMAGFRYMLVIASDLEEKLLQVYVLNDAYSILTIFDNDLELDASEYGDYKDEESLLEDFTDELISSINGAKRIIQIEDNAKDTLNDFFQLEV